jgi:hypothetical protein
MRLLVVHKLVLAKLVFITAFLGSQINVQAQPADFSERSGYRFGLGVGVNRSGDFTQLEVMTPALVEYTIADMLQKTGIVGFVGFHNVYNLTGSSDTVTSQFFKAGFGLENRVSVMDKSRQAYSRIVPVYYSLRDRIFADRDESGLGLRLTIGMDFVLAENRSHWLVGDSSATYYISFDLQTGLPRARTPGSSAELEALNGLSIGAGSRNHF